MGVLRAAGLLLALTLQLLTAVGVDGVRDQKLYRVLGIPADASEEMIKKAYKRKALEYHPDRAKGDKKESERKFQEVAAAYETLGDPKKREVYDMYGEDGVKQQQAGGDPRAQQGFNHRFHQQGGDGTTNFRFNMGGGGGGGDPFGDVFSQFFGGGMGGGQPRGRSRQQQQRQQHPKVDYTGSKVVVIKDGTAWTEQVERSKGIWIVEFYAPWCEHCQELSPEWKKTAESLKGVVKVAALNCDSDATSQICSQLGVKSYPTIIPFRGPRAHARKYSGKRTAKDIVKWALGLVSNLVAPVQSGGELMEALKRCSGSGRGHAGWSTCVVLFTLKTETAPMFKSLALQYEGDVTFLEARGPEAPALARAFGLAGGAELPALAAICNGDNSSATWNSGSLKADAIKKFVDGYRGGRKCASTVRLDSSTDFTKLRVGQLKEILKTAGEDCAGCVEKDDFVKAVKRLTSLKTEL